MNNTFCSRSFKVISNSMSKRVSSIAFVVLKYWCSRCLNMTSTVYSMYMLKENIYSQLFYTKVLNEWKFQLTSNAGKVKETELNTCIIIQGTSEFYSSNKTVSYYNINGTILQTYVPFSCSLNTVQTLSYRKKRTYHPLLIVFSYKLISVQDLEHNVLHLNVAQQLP